MQNNVLHHYQQKQRKRRAVRISTDGRCGKRILSRVQKSEIKERIASLHDKDHIFSSQTIDNDVRLT